MGKLTMRRIRNPYQPIGKRGGKLYVMRGHGFFSKVFNSAKSGLKTLGKTVLHHAKTIAPHVIKAVGPALLTHGASKLGEYASKKGAPDSLVNLGAKAAQLAGKKLQSIEGPKLDRNQQMVSDFVANKSQNLLSTILSQGKDLTQGNGVYGVGGISGLGISGLGISGLGRKGGVIPNNVLSNQNRRQPYSNIASGISGLGHQRRGMAMRHGRGPNVQEPPRIGHQSTY